MRFTNSIRATLDLVAAALLVFVSAANSSAGIRLTVLETGGPSTVFYSDGISLSTSFNTGNFSVDLETVLTNFPGTTIQGKLTQSIDFESTGSSSLTKTFYAYAEVVNDLGGHAFVANETGNASVAALALANFSDPATDPVYGTASTGGSATSTMTGFSSTTSYVSGTPIWTAPQPIPGFGPTFALPVANAAFDYTMAQLVTVFGVGNNSAGFLVTGSSGVFPTRPEGAETPTPEPASMAIWGLGALAFAGYRFRSRKSA